MKKRLFILLIILLAKSNLTAQETVFLDGDLDGTPYVSTHPVILTSILSSLTISGDIQHEVSTSIAPTSDNVILIRASEAVFLLGGGSKGTVIRPKPGISCSPCEKNSTAIKPKIDVKLYQANNNIHIMATEALIIGYTLYDLSGKIIITERTSSTSSYTLTTNELNKAIYILKIDLENQLYKTIKFIKN